MHIYNFGTHQVRKSIKRKFQTFNHACIQIDSPGL
jgi:hypothetical protein